MPGTTTIFASAHRYGSLEMIYMKSKRIFINCCSTGYAQHDNHYFTSNAWFTLIFLFGKCR